MLRHQEEAAIISKGTYNKGQYRSMKQNTVQSVCCEAAVTLEVRGGRARTEKKQATSGSSLITPHGKLKTRQTPWQEIQDEDLFSSSEE